MVAIGEWGEARLAQELGYAGSKSTTAFRTSLGARFHDRGIFANGYEAKAGWDVRLSSTIRTQALKDAELLNTGQIKSMTWYFFRGARPETLEFLQQFGINYVVF